MDAKPVRNYHVLLLSALIITAAVLAITSDKVINTMEVEAANPEESLGSWDLVNSPVSANLKSVSMLSKSDGWIVGEGGIILRWNGNNWSTFVSPTTLTLYDVHMISANNGWAVGDYGKILHWDGVSWSQFDSPTGASLFSMDFLSPTEGWAVGSSTMPCSYGQSGTILKWDGSAWTTVVDSALYIRYRTVEALANNNVWVMGIYQEADCPPLDYHSPVLVIAHWDGQVWFNKIKTQCNNWINSLALMPDSTGWAGGTICLAAFDTADNGTLHPVPAGIISDYNIVSINIVAADDVWAVGGDHLSLPIKSFTTHWNGSSWEAIPNPGNQVLSGVSMISTNDGWAVGYGGTILHYMNDTTTYTYLPLATR